MRHDERKGGAETKNNGNKKMMNRHVAPTCFFSHSFSGCVFLNNKMLIKACALARNGVRMDRGASSESEITGCDK